jgi:hypothetical protein
MEAQDEQSATKRNFAVQPVQDVQVSKSATNSIRFRERDKMIKFRSYRDSSSFTTYVFGINLYDMKTQPTLDIILGKRVFVFFIVRKAKND